MLYIALSRVGSPNCLTILVRKGFKTRSNVAYHELLMHTLMKIYTHTHACKLHTQIHAIKYMRVHVSIWPNYKLAIRYQLYACQCLRAIACKSPLCATNNLHAYCMCAICMHCFQTTCLHKFSNRICIF